MYISLESYAFSIDRLTIFFWNPGISFPTKADICPDSLSFFIKFLLSKIHNK